MAATVVSLLFGLVVMGKGGAWDKKYSNQMMRWRIFCQGGAVLFIVLYLLAR